MASKWTGRLEIPVVGFNGYPMGRLELVLRSDLVDVWLHHQHLATHGRDELAMWLREPNGDLVMDDVTWTMTGNELAIGTRASTELVLPKEFAANLRRLA